MANNIKRTWAGGIVNFIKCEDVEWKNTRYIKEPLEVTDEEASWKYNLLLPRPLADWDVFSYWEGPRLKSMEEHLHKDDILFDIGTEQGWLNIVYAQIVGPSNIVLIEPTSEFWPNIKETWYKNISQDPLATSRVLFGEKHDKDYTIEYNEWPECSNGHLIDRNKYQYIHENTENIPVTTIDEYVKQTTIIPNAITCDIEGAELLMLRGAQTTLKKYKPKLWISIHPDLGFRDYGVKKEDTINFLEDIGYMSEYISTDHEEHYYFEYKK